MAFPVLTFMKFRYLNSDFLDVFHHTYWNIIHYISWAGLALVFGLLLPKQLSLHNHAVTVVYTVIKPELS
jgi:hypothetical protein